ncbi:protein of unknown function [Methylocella tundrae]|uniref:Uncharacterized protein n=1 Tax=Methylocella tundrae TaxID=227605 RepID=A0A4U8Z0T2_METTU|nr:protein of unknown function [Methylocella tundrae]
MFQSILRALVPTNEAVARLNTSTIH